MRVISGIARGRKLATPEGLDVRPTSDRVKEGVFSAIQFEISGKRVLDLFAGSGQLGIEALSRGAASATFVEKDRVAQKIIGNNIALLYSDKKLLGADPEFFNNGGVAMPIPKQYTFSIKLGL